MMHIAAKNNEKNNELCEVLIDFSIVIFSLSSLPVYVFLWYRQRILFSHPSLKRVNMNKIKFFSNLFIVLLFLGGGSSCFIKTIPVSYKMSKFGCVKRLHGDENMLESYTTAVTLVVSQVILFALFVHPLRMHRNVTSANLSTAKKTG